MTDGEGDEYSPPPCSLTTSPNCQLLSFEYLVTSSPVAPDLQLRLPTSGNKSFSSLSTIPDFGFNRTSSSSTPSTPVIPSIRPSLFVPITLPTTWGFRCVMRDFHFGNPSKGYGAISISSALSLSSVITPSMSSTVSVAGLYRSRSRSCG